MAQGCWDDYLIAEHEMIERAMAVLREELTALRERTTEPLRLRRALDFLLQFGDVVHNAKEEEILFPLFEERGIPRKGGPIALLSAEHRNERGLLKQLLGKLAQLSELSDEDAEALIKEGETYLKERAEHIWRENDMLFPMGKKALTDEDNRGLVEAFEAFGQRAYGSSAAGHFKEMLYEAEQGGRETPLIEGLSYEQIHAILEAFPGEITFVDADDSVAYFNRLDKDKIFARSRSVVGRKVFTCHPESSVEQVKKIVEGFKAGTMDKADFWIDYKGDKVLIQYLPVRDAAGEYLGTLEVTQGVGWIQALEGQRRLLDG